MKVAAELGVKFAAHGTFGELNVERTFDSGVVFSNLVDRDGALPSAFGAKLVGGVEQALSGYLPVSFDREGSNGETVIVGAELKGVEGDVGGSFAVLIAALSPGNVQTIDLFVEQQDVGAAVEDGFDLVEIHLRDRAGNFRPTAF